VEGVRLQSELRGLLAKLGAGADVEAALDERDRLRVRMAQADAQAAEVSTKLRLLEAEVKECKVRLEDARRESEELAGKLRAEKRAREASEDTCRTLESERDDLQRELRDAKDNMAAERRALNGLRGDLNKVKDIRVSWLSAAELDDLFRRHDRDNSGDISAEEMKPFVEELCDIMQRRMESLRDEAQRVTARADAAEADRERDRQRAKESEARLSKQVERLEQDLETSDNAARSQVQQLQDRAEKQRVRLEASSQSPHIVGLFCPYSRSLLTLVWSTQAALEAAKADGVAEALRVQQEADAQLAKRESIHAAKFADLDTATSAEIARRKTREEELNKELASTRALLEKSDEKLKVTLKSLEEHKARVARLEKEAAASKSQTVIQEVFALHGRLGTARRQLQDLRAHAEEVNEAAAQMIRETREQLQHFCTFILPLPHEAADKVRTDKLSPAQLAQGLKHMMGKYRGAAELNRKQNLELQSLKGAMRVYCRVRPLRPGPEAEDGTCLHLRGLGALSMLDKSGTKEFLFDLCYGPNSKQEGIFGVCVYMYICFRKQFGSN
jgi:kinesin family protein C2/C3